MSKQLILISGGHNWDKEGDRGRLLGMLMFEIFLQVIVFPLGVSEQETKLVTTKHCLKYTQRCKYKDRAKECHVACY